MKKTTDIRIVKTQRAITKEFLELMNEIGFSKISVNKIIERAEINRSTFYSHYTDKYDLLDKIENELLLGLINIAKSSPIDITSPQDLDDEILFNHILHAAEYLYENANSFSLFMSEKGDPAFINKIGEVVKSIWVEKKIYDKMHAPQSYVVTVIVGIFKSMITVWIENDFRESPQEFALIFLQMVKDFPQKFFQPMQTSKINKEHELKNRS